MFKITVPNIILPPGGRMPNILDYASGLNPYEFKDDNCWINQIGCVASQDKDTLLVVQTTDIHFSLLPGHEFSPRLYRGQPRFYEKCVPSLFREPMTRIKFVTGLLKTYEFYKLMTGHPLITCLQNWSIDGKFFKIDMEGLSAHYEFATPMIDVTRNKNVAMFFATCSKKDAQSNQYEPITDEDREAVLYTINLKAILEAKHPGFHEIGFQALPRPSAQEAYSILAGHGENFNDYLFVEKELFRIKRKDSEKYFEMFEGGAKLFPEDPVDDMAFQIRQSKEIDSEVFETSIDRHYLFQENIDKSEIRKFLEKAKYTITDKKLQFSGEIQQKIIKRWNNCPPIHNNNVKCRPCYASTSI